MTSVGGRSASTTFPQGDCPLKPRSRRLQEPQPLGEQSPWGKVVKGDIMEGADVKHGITVRHLGWPAQPNIRPCIREEAPVLKWGYTLQISEHSQWGRAQLSLPDPISPAQTLSQRPYKRIDWSSDPILRWSSGIDDAMHVHMGGRLSRESIVLQ
jgi:hypothetical protein